MYLRPIELVENLHLDLWAAIDEWAAIPTTPETIEARVAAAAKIEFVIANGLKLQNLVDARMALDQLTHRLRDGGPETPREKIRETVKLAAGRINEIVPRSPLR